MHDGPLLFINYCSPGGWWSLAPPLEHRLCFVFATGDSRRVGGAAWVSGLVELLLLLLGCLALLGYTSSPGAWPVGRGVDPFAVRRLGDLSSPFEGRFGSAIAALLATCAWKPCW